MTYAEYLELASSWEVKHEYEDGVAVAMTGGTLEHSRLASELGALIRNALNDKPCRVLSADARIRIESTNRALYPDLSVVCDEPQTAADDPDGLTNPVIIVEVLSPTTEANDRGAKFAHYRRLPSVREYVLVSQDVARVEVFRRDGDRWSLYEHGPGDAIALPSVEAEVSVDQLYRGRIG